jgi:flagellin-like hook-associated protein FlgL
VLAGLGALAAQSFTAADKDEHAALADRTRVALVAPAGAPSVDGMATEIGLAGATLSAAAERHGATEALLKDTLGSVENASREEVAAKLLALQTQLQASYQTTSMLSRLSLVNYL